RQGALRAPGLSSPPLAARPWPRWSLMAFRLCPKTGHSRTSLRSAMRRRPSAARSGAAWAIEQKATRWRVRELDDCTPRSFPHSNTPLFHLLSRYRSLLVPTQRVEVFLDLGDAQHFFNRGLCCPDLVPAVDAQGAHAELDGLLGNGRGRSAVQDQRAQRLVQDQEFIDAHAPLITQVPASLATGAMIELRRLDFVCRETNPAQITALDLLLLLAMRTNGAD